MDQGKLFKTVYQVGKKIGLTAYVVGGFVRNELMEESQKHLPAIRLSSRRWQAGKNTKKDIDFVVLGDAIAFAKAFDKTMKQTGSLVEFSNFGTARYVMGEGEKKMEIEFASARSEKYDAESRKPEVAPATLEADLSRRDFTVNAMARAVLARGKLGDIIDPYHGREDLAAGVIKTPLDPNETFFDDPLRMLRAARFAAQLHCVITTEVLAAMERNRARLKIISAERIREELFKLLSTDKPSIGLWILYQTKLCHEFFPEIVALAGVEEVAGYSHKDNLSHTFAVVDNLAEHSDKTLLRFAGLVHDIAKPQTKKFIPGRGWTFDMHEHLGKKMVYTLGRRLRLSRDETAYVAKLVRWHLQPIALMDEGITDSAVRRLIVNVGDDLADLLRLCRSDITTGNQQKKVRRLKNYDRLDQRIIEVIEKDKLRAFQSPVRGDEIMALTGLKPGPTIGKIKSAIEEAILAGTIPNEYEAAKAYFLAIKDGYLKQAEEWEKTHNAK